MRNADFGLEERLNRFSFRNPKSAFRNLKGVSYLEK
jgi:hypothetical protein